MCARLDTSDIQEWLHDVMTVHIHSVNGTKKQRIEIAFISIISERKFNQKCVFDEKYQSSILRASFEMSKEHYQQN